MSSVLDALAPAELAQVEAAVHARGLERMLVEDALYEMLRQQLVREVLVGAPGAGAEWTASVPGGATWELLEVSYTLATSAAVANRATRLQVKDQDGNLQGGYATAQTQAASLTRLCTRAAGIGTTLTTSGDLAPLPNPPLVVAAGWTVGTSTTSLDAGDAYSAIVVTVREWSPLAVVRECRELLGDLDSAGGIRYGAVR